jgi:hypothetical protein
MKTRLALAALLAALMCVPAASAGRYPACDAHTYAGAVCSVRSYIASIPAEGGHGPAGQSVRCAYASRRVGWYGPHGRVHPRFEPRWSCHTATHWYVVMQSDGRVYFKLVLGVAR